MKNVYLGLFLLLGFSLSVNAQNDPAAKKVLDAVGAKVKAAKGISATCVLASFTSKGKSNGTQSLSLQMKGEKYFVKQGRTEIVCDGRDVYRYDGDKTITKSSVEESSQTLSPQKLLAGAYDRDFTYKLVSSRGSFQEIEMKPIDSRKNFQKVNLFIDKAKNTFAKARILDKSNNVTELKITKLNLNAKVADNSFVFNRAKYPKDAEILD
ncbi:LolA family protein [Sediminibacterium soli]|uniref:LolA family protein n=1 Tax=Sediminibacterium soli TaxID=2698829 RepID=UPI00137B19BA|nr:outer membrane lipoprotein carrier protein LolA [Sediminibacterium soli]NCI46059.1 outer membrane lipoprotein carrier protein LolA [Sediminibacterium soli]